MNRDLDKLYFAEKKYTKSVNFPKPTHVRICLTANLISHISGSLILISAWLVVGYGNYVQTQLALMWASATTRLSFESIFLIPEWVLTLCPPTQILDCSIYLCTFCCHVNPIFWSGSSRCLLLLNVISIRTTFSTIKYKITALF